jgi:DNA-binding response OmpR family regulator
MRILIIEDEQQLTDSIIEYLHAEQFVCERASDYNTAYEKISMHEYDCILLDLTLPGGNGLELLKTLKEQNKTEGVLIISAKGSLEDKVIGLKLGADDYLPKPFHLAELDARIKALMRRRKFDGKDFLEFHDIKINTQAKTVAVQNKEVSLTKTEYDLLLFLITNKNRVVSKNAIAEHLSGDHAEYLDNYDFVYAHIKNLKKKISDPTSSTEYIKTVYGLGYKFSK